MTANLPNNAWPITEEQQRLLKALTQELTRAQALWLGGYLTSIADRLPDQPLSAPAGDAAPKVHVLYATETGNSRALAGRLSERLERAGIAYKKIDLADLRPRQLSQIEIALFITATHGDGDPPEHAVRFFETLDGGKMPELSGLRFAVLALGDSSYERFCETGRRLDERLEALGGERLRERVECDVDFETLAGPWIEAVTAQVGELVPAAAAASAPPPRLVAVETPGAARYDRSNPFAATVVENQVLNDRGSQKETLHVALDIAGSGLRYQPGDSLGVVTANDRGWVEELLAALELTGEERVSQAGEEMRLAEALTHKLELTRITPKVLEFWAERSGAEALHALLGKDRREARQQFTSTYQVMDLARHWPLRGIDAQALVDGLRPLVPRLYSIASSQAVAEDEVHLLVARIDYEVEGMRRGGVASNDLARAELEDSFGVYVQENPRFRLPEDGETPIIMIGPGTGVAPYRAFLQELEAMGRHPETWLFFGEQRFAKDFLYQREWLDFLQRGVLTRMDVAFSRDQAEKVYVQHRIDERGREVYDWLERGARVYVCGDEKHMAKDVHRTLAAVIGREAGRDPEYGESYLSGMQAEGRYLKDVY